MKTQINKSALIAASALLFVTLSGLSVVGDPCKSYDWGTYTVAPHDTDTFTVDYNNGEWADAKAVPDYNDDDIDMKVYDSLGMLEIIRHELMSHRTVIGGLVFFLTRGHSG